MQTKTLDSNLRFTFCALESYSMVGGLQQFNRRVVSALAEISFKSNLFRPTIILKGDTEQDIAQRIENVNFIACGSSHKKVAMNILKFAKYTDIMFFGHINLLPMAILAKLVNPRLKTVLFVHGHDVWNTKGTRQKKKWESWALNFIDKIASVSEFTATLMSDAFHVPKDKFYLFPNAVDPLVFDKKIVENSNTSSFLLTVSRMAEHDIGKHVDSVLRAMPEIRKYIPNVRYRVIGDGILRSQLQKLAQDLAVADIVDFMGRVSDEELAQSYAGATVFVMPSEKEGFGIVFLEAWLRYVPVICGTEDASHEVITDGVDGYAIHHDDIPELAKKITDLLLNPEKAKAMGEAGYKKVQQQYLMTTFTQNLAKLIEEIISA
ncbi:glycosyltransferase family 4 protein [Acinetobacter qingfengensis]|uniref:Uncharacterized protein n=1 Tax=Acinetobacter qingfengensis TaxID=1262585 RepID=A0A1E7RCK8_9GAMM|nr:glycosyltransferase family 4 protein [Acinetobacter qingfengensis]KAA8732060.1 glycosyltransferase family 4 protein [Acinetobacter qingfengensis]OEY97140.1 hypothetical protein BJI46_01540 [Acinetobacter qingfengensis]